MKENNSRNRPIVVGKKPVANYALAIATRIVVEDQVTLRARGRLIGIMFDAANKAINMELPVSRGEVRWGQEQGPEGQMVSWAEVELVKKGM